MAKETAEKKVFVRVEDNVCGYSSLMSYVNALNEQCLPVIEELGLVCKDAKKMLLYCALGGRSRMMKDFTDGLTPGTAMYKLALIQFEKTLSDHPKYFEIGNKWKWAKLIKISNNGMFEIDDEAVKERNTVYITKQIGQFEKLQTVVNLLNDIIPFISRYKTSRGALHELFYYDKNDRKWKINTTFISDYYFESLLHEEGQEFSKSAWELQKEKEGNEIFHSTIEKTMNEFGLSEDEKDQAFESMLD